MGTEMESKNRKIDYHIVLSIIEPDSRILDLGCGDGALLGELVREKNAVVQGIELSQESILKCVERGINVFHSDLDSGLKDYPDKSFDYVILNETLQQLIKPDWVLRDALRCGKKVIVGFPNFTYAFNIRYLPPIARIDYIFHDSQFQPLTIRVGTDSAGSDHYPIFAELALTSSPKA